MNKTLTLVMVIAALGLTGCSKAEWSTVKSWGIDHKVILYSGGQIVRTWTTTGQVQEKDGGECFFQDAATGLPVSIYGTWTVEIVR